MRSVIAAYLVKQARVKHSEAGYDAVTFIQRFGSVAKLNICLHCLVLDEVYRRIGCWAVSHEAYPPATAELQGLPDEFITNMKRVLNLFASR